mmetsp:Transcript_15738/g.38031  ORF Transcript_15738/g.38031 Transcript_15738/m.38031 type:complete len:245 (+) Transcript_15738:841-1575(+)
MLSKLGRTRWRGRTPRRTRRSPTPSRRRRRRRRSPRRRPRTPRRGRSRRGRTGPIMRTSTFTRSPRTLPRRRLTRCSVTLPKRATCGSGTMPPTSRLTPRPTSTRCPSRPTKPWTASRRRKLLPTMRPKSRPTWLKRPVTTPMAISGGSMPHAIDRWRLARRRWRIRRRPFSASSRPISTGTRRRWRTTPPTARITSSPTSTRRSRRSWKARWELRARGAGQSSWRPPTRCQKPRPRQPPRGKL